MRRDCDGAILVGIVGSGAHWAIHRSRGGLRGSLAGATSAGMGIMSVFVRGRRLILTVREFLAPTAPCHQGAKPHTPRRQASLIVLEGANGASFL